MSILKGTLLCKIEMMKESASLYHNFRLATAYAFDRPPVHQSLVRQIRADLRPDGKFNCALDVGCGAGLSTAALLPYTEMVVGLEPAPVMLAHHHAVAPAAFFVVGQAERLPFKARIFDLLTAAGSLNYVDLDRFLPEAARVLTPDGTLVIYDFSPGRRLRESDRLDAWYQEFERRYPAPPGYALDVTRLAYEKSGLRLARYQEREVVIPMTLETYLSYVLSEAGVALAWARGVPEKEIRSWCQHTLQEIFSREKPEVCFMAYLAYVQPTKTN